MIELQLEKAGVRLAYLWRCFGARLTRREWRRRWGALARPRCAWVSSRKTKGEAYANRSLFALRLLAFDFGLLSTGMAGQPHMVLAVSTSTRSLHF